MGRKLNHDEKHYSISQLNLFSLCPRKYKFTYVDRLPYTPVYNLESGKALHNGLEANNLKIIDGMGAMKSEDVVEFSVSSFKEDNRDRIEDADFDLGEGVDQLVGDISGPVEKYKQEAESAFVVQGIESAEEPFELELAGERVIGYTDLVTKEAVLDYKLIGRKKARQAVDMDPQLVLYEHVTGKPGGFVQLIRKRQRAEVDVPRRTPSCTKAILKWAEDQITFIEHAKKTGDFHPISPTNWMCNRCQYRYKCWNTR